MRILQKRVKDIDCLRKDQIEVEKYKRFVTKCNYLYFSPENEFTEDIVLPEKINEYGEVEMP